MKTKTVIVRKQLPKRVASANLTKKAYWTGFKEGAADMHSYHVDMSHQLDVYDLIIDPPKTP